MAHVLVAGSINVDRLWRLAGPLAAGGRVTHGGTELRIGGGGFSTGATLLALGHHVTLVTTLSTDDAGRACLEALSRLRFDVRHVRLTEAPTIPLEIFIDPSGDRTILAPAATEARRLTALPPATVDMAYVNVRRAEPGLLAELAGRTRVVAQVPLEAGEHRPAEILVASASDHAFPSGEGALRQARQIGGPALSALVLTDGARPVEVCDDAGRSGVPVAPLTRPTDTTGAGDVFAAGLIDGLLRGAPAVAAVRRGNEIAARFLADRRAFWHDPVLSLSPVLRAEPR